MCGRIVQKTNLGNVVANLGMDAGDLVDRAPRYNIPPGSLILTIREDSKVSYLKWGLVPSWATDPKIGFKLSNARSESVQEKPSFKKAFKSRRCIVPVDGFYEWQQVDGKKKPYFIHRKDNELLCIAGIWESWKSPTGETLETCCVLTTAAQAPIEAIHDRMPVFVPNERIKEWLDSKTEITKLTELFTNSITQQEIVITPVSPMVNNARIDNADCILAEKVA